MRTYSQIATDKEKCIQSIIKELKQIDKPRPLSSVRRADVTEEEYEQFKVDIDIEKEMYEQKRDYVIDKISDKYGFKGRNIRRVLSISENFN